MIYCDRGHKRSLKDACLSSLPVGWQVDTVEAASTLSTLSALHIRRIVACEVLADRGLFVTREHSKGGYRRVILPPHHPYAAHVRRRGRMHRHCGGYQLLHRYIMMRHLRRWLEPWEHVHHVDGADKATTDIEDLELLEEICHGVYHCGRWRRCGRHIVPCPDCGDGGGDRGEDRREGYRNCDKCGGARVVEGGGA